MDADQFPFVTVDSLPSVVQELDKIFQFNQRFGVPVKKKDGGIVVPVIQDEYPRVGEKFLNAHESVYRTSKILEQFRTLVNSLIELEKANENARKEKSAQLNKFVLSVGNSTHPLMLIACALFYVDALTKVEIPTVGKTDHIAITKGFVKKGAQNETDLLAMDFLDRYIYTVWFCNILVRLVYIEDYRAPTNGTAPDTWSNFKTIAALGVSILDAAREARPRLGNFEIDIGSVAAFEETSAGKIIDVDFGTRLGENVPVIGLNDLKFIYAQTHIHLTRDLRKRVSSPEVPSFKVNLPKLYDFVSAYAFLVAAYSSIPSEHKSDAFFKQASVDVFMESLQANCMTGKRVLFPHTTESLVPKLADGSPSKICYAEILILASDDTNKEKRDLKQKLNDAEEEVRNATVGGEFLEREWDNDMDADDVVFHDDGDVMDVVGAVENDDDVMNVVSAVENNNDDDGDDDDDGDGGFVAQEDDNAESDGVAGEATKVVAVEDGRWDKKKKTGNDTLYVELRPRLISLCGQSDRLGKMVKFGLTQQQDDLHSICAMESLSDFLAMARGGVPGHLTRLIKPDDPSENDISSSAKEKLVTSVVFLANLDLYNGLCMVTKSSLALVQEKAVYSITLPFPVCYTSPPMHILALLCKARSGYTNQRYGMSFFGNQMPFRGDRFILSIRRPSQAAIYGAVLSRLLKSASLAIDKNKLEHTSLLYFENLVKFATGKVLAQSPEQTFNVWIAGYFAAYMLLMRASRATDKPNATRKEGETMNVIALSETAASFLQDAERTKLYEDAPNCVIAVLATPRNVDFVRVANFLLGKQGGRWNEWISRNYGDTHLAVDWKQEPTFVDGEKYSKNTLKLFLEVDRLLSKTPWLPNVFNSLETSTTFHQTLKAVGTSLVQKCDIASVAGYEQMQVDDSSPLAEYVDYKRDQRNPPKTASFLPTITLARPDYIDLDENAQCAAVVMDAVFADFESVIETLEKQLLSIDMESISELSSNFTNPSEKTVHIVDTLIAPHVCRIINITFPLENSRDIGGVLYQAMTVDLINHLHIPATVRANFTFSPVIFDQLVQNLVDVVCAYHSAVSTLIEKGIDPSKVNTTQSLFGKCWNSIAIHTRTLLQCALNVAATFQTDVYLEQVAKFDSFLNYAWAVGEQKMSTEGFLKYLQEIGWAAFSSEVIGDFELITQVVGAESRFAKMQSSLMTLVGPEQRSTATEVRLKYAKAFVTFFANCFAAWNEEDFDFGAPSLELKQSVTKIPVGPYLTTVSWDSSSAAEGDSDADEAAKVSIDIAAVLTTKHTFGTAHPFDIQFPINPQVRRFVEFTGPILTKANNVADALIDSKVFAPDLANAFAAITIAMRQLFASMAIQIDSKVFFNSEKRAAAVATFGVAERGEITNVDPKPQRKRITPTKSKKRKGIDSDQTDKTAENGDDDNIAPATKRTRGAAQKTILSTLNNLTNLGIFSGIYPEIVEDASVQAETVNPSSVSLSKGAQEILDCMVTKTPATCLLVGRYLNSTSDMKTNILESLETAKNFTLYHEVKASPEAKLRSAYDKLLDIVRLLRGHGVQDSSVMQNFAVSPSTDEVVDVAVNQFLFEDFEEKYAMEIVGIIGENLLNFVADQEATFGKSIGSAAYDSGLRDETPQKANMAWMEISDAYTALVFRIIQKRFVDPVLTKKLSVHDGEVLFSDRQTITRRLGGASSSGQQISPATLDALLFSRLCNSLHTQQLYPDFTDFLEEGLIGENLQFRFKVPDLPLDVIQSALYALSGYITRVYIVTSVDPKLLAGTLKNFKSGKLEISIFAALKSSDNKKIAAEWKEKFDETHNTPETLIVVTSSYDWFKAPEQTCVLYNRGNFKADSRMLADYQLIVPAKRDAVADPYAAFRMSQFFQHTEGLGGSNWQLAQAQSRLRQEQRKVRQLQRRVNEVENVPLKSSMGAKLVSAVTGAANSVVRYGIPAILGAAVGGISYVAAQSLDPVFQLVQSNYVMPLQKRGENKSGLFLLNAKLEETQKRLKFARTRAGADIAKIDQLESDINGVQLQLATKIAEYQTESMQWAATSAEQARDLVDEKRKVQEKTQELAAAQAELVVKVREHEQEKISLEQSKLALEQDQSQKEQQIATLNATAANTAAAVAERDAELAALRAQMSEANQRAVDLTAQITAQTSAAAAKEADLNAQLVQIQATFAEQKTRIETELAQLSNTLAQQMALGADNSAVIAGLQAEKTRLQLQLSQLADGDADARLRIDQEIARLRSELATQRGTHEAAVNALKTRVTQIKAKSREETEKRMQIATQLETATMEIDQLRGELATSRENYERAERRVGNATIVIRSQQTDLQNEIQQLKTTIRELSTANSVVAARAVSTDTYTRSWRSRVTDPNINLVKVASLIHAASSTLLNGDLLVGMQDFAQDMENDMKNYSQLSRDSEAWFRDKCPEFATVFLSENIEFDQLFDWFFTLFTPRERETYEIGEFRETNERFFNADKTNWTLGWFLYFGLIVTNHNVFELLVEIEKNDSDIDTNLTRLFEKCPTVLTYAKFLIYQYLQSTSTPIPPEVTEYMSHFYAPNFRTLELDDVLIVAFANVNPGIIQYSPTDRLDYLKEIVLSAYETPSYIGLCNREFVDANDAIDYMINGRRNSAVPTMQGMDIYNGFTPAMISLIQNSSKNGYIGNTMLALQTALNTAPAPAPASSSDVFASAAASVSPGAISEALTRALLGLSPQPRIDANNKYADRLANFEEALSATTQTAATDVSFAELMAEQARTRKATREAERYKREKNTYYNFYVYGLTTATSSAAELAQKEREIAVLSVLKNDNMATITRLRATNAVLSRAAINMKAQQKVGRGAAVKTFGKQAIDAQKKAAKIAKKLKKVKKALKPFKDRQYKTVVTAVEAYFKRAVEQKVEILEALLAPKRKEAMNEKFEAELTKIKLQFLKKETNVDFKIMGFDKNGPVRTVSALLPALPQTSEAKDRFKRIASVEQARPIPQPPSYFGLNRGFQRAAAGDLEYFLSQNA